ncbi:MAG: polyprenyl diphosphate synthase [bacterium]|nr:polyprenyl diphosphate synthase [bacterium]
MAAADHKEKPSVPEALGIIMDGNRRYARARNLPLMRGHEAGYEKLKEFLRWAKEAGVRTVYAYAFSTENWNRAKKEVGYLVRLLERAIIDEEDELKKEKISVRFIGELDRFSPKLQEAMKKIERETRGHPHTLVLAVSYGGRAELLTALKKLAKEGKETITEENFSKYLYTAGLPDPDLIIRTSGEVRTSNFLPWQSAYSEWYFTKTLWPAFEKKEFDHILADYAARERRNGK